MFKTHAGPVEDAGAVAYLRPETAQGMFTNFANVLNTTRKKPPFGIAQVGKSFRNEITPQNWIFRTREFEQMEMEYFVPPAESTQVVRVLVHRALQTGTSSSASPSRCCACVPHDADELSHYSSGTSDVEFLFPWGWDELEGIAQRTDYDLTQHAEHSGEKLDYFDQTTGERYRPYVIEPAVGVTRLFAIFLLAAYDEDVVNDETRTVLRLHPRLAPYKVAVLPLSEEGDADAARPRGAARRSASATWSTTTRRRRSAVATAARTRSARRCASRSTSTRSTTGRDDPRPRHHRAGAGPDRRRRRHRGPARAAVSDTTVAPGVTTYLDRILERHRASPRPTTRSLDALLARGHVADADSRVSPASLADAEALAVISEIKRRSPSKGDLNADLDPALMARTYEDGGATCLSVLTDEEFFGGSVGRPASRPRVVLASRCSARTSRCRRSTSSMPG